MCTVLLPPGVNPIAVNKYIISYHNNSGIFTEFLLLKKSYGRWKSVPGIKNLLHFSLQHLLKTHFAMTNYLASPVRDVEQNRTYVFMWNLGYFYPIPTVRQSLASSIIENRGNLLIVSRIVHSEYKGSHSDTISRIFADGPKLGDAMEVRRCSSRHSGRHTCLMFGFERLNAEK